MTCRVAPHRLRRMDVAIENLDDLPRLDAGNDFRRRALEAQATGEFRLGRLSDPAGWQRLPGFARPYGPRSLCRSSPLDDRGRERQDRRRSDSGPPSASSWPVPPFAPSGPDGPRATVVRSIRKSCSGLNVGCRIAARRECVAGFECSDDENEQRLTLRLDRCQADPSG